MKKMYFKLEKISPDVAKHYLEYDQTKDKQRPKSPHQISKYASIMKSGEWKETPEPIAFDWDGNLVNGQHRLAAVIESGCTISFTVAYDCDPAIFAVLDQGKLRSGSDLFTIMYKQRFAESPANCTHVAAVASRMLQRLKDHSSPKHEAAEHAMRHFKLIQRMLPISKSREAGSTGVCAAFCNAAIYFGEEKIAPLADRYSSGMWASTTDPLKALSDRIVRARIKESRQHVLSKGEHYSLGVAAIRAALVGGQRARLEATKHDFGGRDEDKKIRGAK